MFYTSSSIVHERTIRLVQTLPYATIFLTRPASPARLKSSSFPVFQLHDRHHPRPLLQSVRAFHSSYPIRLQHDLKPADLQQTKPSRRKRDFSYRLAASYCGKQYRFDSSRHYFSFDSTVNEQYLAGKRIEPDFLKARRIPSGQDACFISAVGTTGAAAFGVADGVGGWIDQGIDSAAFAHGLCTYMAEACQHFGTESEIVGSTVSPGELLEIGYGKVCQDASVIGGGSTACVGIADRDGILNVANLGDSGFIHIRLNKVHHVSEHQTHAFNTPYQLSQIPRKLKDQILEFGGQGPISDMPKHAGITHHPLDHGDVLLFATDGVWDNLTSQDILEIISEKMITSGAWEDGDRKGILVSEALPHLTLEPPAKGREKSLQSILATGVVEKAKQASQNMRRDSPFAKAVKRQFPSERYLGGKVDDICVVVAIAVNGGITQHNSS